MAIIEVDEETKRAVAFAAKMADLSENAVIRRLIAASTATGAARAADTGVEVYADYEGHRVRARFIEPARVEIIDGPLMGRSFKTPTGAARAVIRHFNPDINDNRNGWNFWHLDTESGIRRTLQSIRPQPVRSGRGSLRHSLTTAADWDSPEVNDSIAADFELDR